MLSTREYKAQKIEEERYCRASSTVSFCSRAFSATPPSPASLRRNNTSTTTYAAINSLRLRSILLFPATNNLEHTLISFNPTGNFSLKNYKNCALLLSSSSQRLAFGFQNPQASPLSHIEAIAPSAEYTQVQLAEVEITNDLASI